MKNQSGFTLIEVIVSLVILAMLSLLTAQAIQSAIQNRSFITADIARDAELADAMRIIRSDVTAAFHHRDIFIDLENQAMKGGTPTATPTPKPGDPPPPPPPPPSPVPTPRPSPPVVTGFVGETGSMYFTSLSNVRTLRDSMESDQAKIGYFVKSCRSPNTGANKDRTEGKCLYRSTTPFLDKEIEKPGVETVLIENVQEFKLRFTGPGKEDYVGTWRTDANGDADTKNVFPWAVEVTLTVVDNSGEKPRPLTAVALIPLRFPNNAKKASPTPEGQAPAGPGGEGPAD